MRNRFFVWRNAQLSILKRLNGRSDVRGPASQLQRAAQGVVERLEGRTLFSTVTWTGGSGDWFTAAKWSGGVLPSSVDEAVIPAGSNITLSANEGYADIDTIAAASGSTISVATGSILRAREGGTIASTLNIAAGGMLMESYSGSTLTLSGTTTSIGSMEADGASTIINTGTIAFQNGGGLVAGFIINKATVTAANGMLLDGTFTNNTGATFTLTDDGGFTPYTYPGLGLGTFINNGTFTKSGGTGTSEFGELPANPASYPTGNFENIGGTINIQSGTFVVHGSAQLSDTTFNIAAGAAFRFAQYAGDTTSYYTIGLSGNITGSGGGTVDLDQGDYLPQTEDRTDTDATLNFPDGMLNVTTGMFDQVSYETASINNTGFITIDRPTNSGVVSMVNRGTVHVTGPGGLPAGVFVNDTAGVLDIATDGPISAGAGNVLNLQNKGLLRKSAGSGTTIINNSFENDGGSVEIDSGTISLQGGSDGWIAGPLTIATGSVLNFAVQFYMDMQGTMSATGGGIVTVTSGYMQGPHTFSFTSPDEDPNAGANLAFAPNTFYFEGGYLSDSNNIINSGTAYFQGGGTLDQMDNTGTIYIDGGSYQVNKGTTLINEAAGTVIFTGATTLAAGVATQISNAGLIQFNAGTGTIDLATPYQPYFSSTAAIVNTGTFEVVSGTVIYPASSLDSTDIPAGAGFRIDSGAQLTTDTPLSLTTINGSVTLAGASASFPDIAGVNTVNGTFAVLSGAMFSTTGSLTNAGTLSVGGALTVNGSLTESGAASTLDFPVAAAAGSVTAPDLIVTGATTLAGNLKAEYAGGFAASAGTPYTVATFSGGSSGSFASTAGTSPDFTTTINASTIQLNGTAIAAGDLQASNVTAPASFTPGQNSTVSWTVTNAGAAVTASWVDSVYLSPTGTLAAGDLFLGNVTHTGGLAANGSYTGTLTTPFPAAAGSYKVVVVVDSGLAVGDTNRANNIAVSAATLSTLPTLTLGASVSGNLVAGEDLVYQLTLAGGQDVVLTGNFAVAGGSDIEVSRNAYPGIGAGQFSAQPDTTTTTQSIRMIAAAAGTYFIRITGEPIAGSSDAYTLSAAVPAPGVSGVSATSLGQGVVSPTVFGSGFTSSSVVTLVDGSGNVVATPSSVVFGSSTAITPTFDLSGVAAGSYSIEVTTPGQTATSIAVTVTAATTSNPLQITVTAPSATRNLRVYDFVITYHNASNVDVAPVWLRLVEPGLEFRLASGNTDANLGNDVNFSQGNFNVATINQEGDAAKLGPGYTGQLVVEFRSIENLADNVYTPVLSQVGGQIDLAGFVGSGASQVSELSAEILRERIDGDSYGTGPDYDASPNLVVNYSDFANYLFSIASTLSRANVHEASVDNLIAYALDSVDSFGQTTQKQTAGSFGYGSEDPLRYSLVVPTSPVDGDVATFQTPDGNREFIENSGVFVSGSPSDAGTLTQVNGVYQISDADGSFYQFDSKNNLTYERTPGGLTTTYTRNDQGQITAVTAPNGQTTTYVYNSMGVVTSSTDANGNTTTYGYKVDTQQLETINPLTEIIRGEHGTITTTTVSFPLLTTITSPAGTMSITWTATPQTLYTSLLNADGTTKLVELYTSVPTDEFLPTSITFPDGTGTVYTYDSQARLLTSSQLDGSLATSFSYDASGLQVVATLPDGSKDVGIIGLGGQVLRETSPDGTVVTQTYGGSTDSLLSSTSSDGNTTNLTYANGVISTAVNADGSGATFTSDTAGHILTETLATGSVYTFTHNADGQTTSVTYPDGTSQLSTFDADGRPSVSTSRDSSTATSTYAAAGGVAGINFSSGASYAFTYDAHGNELTATGPAGTVTYTYNSANHVTSETDAAGHTLNYTYNAAGQLSQISDSSGIISAYTYDADGRIATVSSAAGQVAQYTYDARGRESMVTNGNGTKTVYTYTADNLPASIVNLDSQNTVISSQTYVFNSADLIASMTDQAGNVTTYQYDAGDRLIQATLPGGRIITYTYDFNGNRISSTDSGTTTAYTTNGLDEYTAVGSTTYTYNANGDLATETSSAGTTTYTYGVSNQLVGSTGPNGTFTYTYDTAGELTAFTDNGVLTTLQRDAFGDVIAAYDGSGNLISHFLYGNQLIGQADGSGGSQFYNADAVGNILQTTGSSGAVVNTYGYLPSGEKLTTTGPGGNLFTFGGAQSIIDVGDGLYQAGVRTYSPALGKFLEPDPQGIEASSNLYTYAGNDPVSSVDPNGAEYVTYGFDVHIVAGGGVDIKVSDSGDVYLEVKLGLGAGAGGGSGSVQPGQPTTGLTMNGQVAVGSGFAGSFPVIDTINDGVTAAVTGKSQKFENDFTVVPIAGPYAGGSVDLGLTANLTAIGVPFFKAQPYGSQWKPDPSLYGSRGTQKLDNMNAHVNSTEQSSIINYGGDVIASKRIFHFKVGDPNDLVGPTAYGDSNFVPAGQAFDYTIDFANEPTANASVQQVTVTETLDPHLNWSTFELTGFGFGSFNFTIPAGLQAYHAQEDVTAVDGVIVDFLAAFNPTSGLITWTLTALDPTTLQPTTNNALGFLPPDVTSPEGEGYLTYRITPNTGLSTGTQIHSQASIVFEDNAAIATNNLLDTIDAAAPTSSVTALPATQTNTHFKVSWSGQDDTGGSGITSYDIYVSIDGGAQQPWQTNTTSTSGTYTGAPGHTYSFISIAHDGAGNLETSPAAAVSTTVPAIDHTITFGGKNRATYTDSNGNKVTIVLSGPGSGVLSFLSSGNVDPISMVLTGTTAGSRITVTSRGFTHLYDVQVNGSLGQFNAARADFAGTFDVTGTLGTLTLADVVDGVSTIQIQGVGPATTFRFGTLHDVAITTASTIRSLTAAAWTNAVSTSDALYAPSIQSMTVRGNLDARLTLTSTAVDLASLNVTGALSGTWSLAGGAGALRAGSVTTGWAATVAGAITSITTRFDFDGSLTARSIRSATIGGAFSGAALNLTGTSGVDLTSLSVRGALTDSTIASTASIGTVTVGGMSDSTLFAGITSGVTGLPTAASDLVTGVVIKSFNDLGRSAFADSSIAAYSLGSVTLRNVTTDNSGTLFGVAAHVYGSFALLQPKAKPVRYSGKAIKSTITTLGGDLRLEVL